MATVGKMLVVAGGVLVVAGLAWPWLSRLPIGRLPGDIVIRRDSFSLYVPIVTCLLVSAVATLLMWLLRR